MNSVSENILKAFERSRAFERCKTDLSFQPSEAWKVLFDFYNSESGNVPLNMACEGCYKKVLKWIEDILLETEL